MKLGPVVVLATAVLVCGGVRAADVTEVDVTVTDGRYFVASSIRVEAPLDAVFATLADYDEFERVSSIFKESHFIEREENGEGLVYTRMHDCLLFFCKTIERVETLELHPPEKIVTTVIPDRSDVRSGETRWLLSASDGGTDIRHEMDMEPDFWVPPVIGPYLVKRYLRKGSTRAAVRLENIALEVAAKSASNEQD